MPTPVPVSCITTPDAVRAQAVGAVAVRLPEHYEMVLGLCVSATHEVEQYLDRAVIVRPDYYPALPWVKTQGGYETQLRQWPTVQHDGPVSVTLAADTAGRAVSPYVTSSAVTIYAGYRREDQTLETLQTVYPDLEALPPLVPGAIEQATIDLVLFRLQQKKAGYAMSTETNVGAGSVRTSRMQGSLKMDVDPAQEILSRLRAYRFFTL